MIMANRRTLEERIQEKDLHIQQLLGKAKRYQAQIRQLERMKKEEERKARTHKLIKLGGAVISVLDRDYVDADDFNNCSLILLFRLYNLAKKN